MARKRSERQPARPRASPPILGNLTESMRLGPSLSPLVGAALALFGCAAVPKKPPPLTFSEAGLAPLEARAKPRARSALDRATDALLSAIERQTGERPVFDADAGTLAPPTPAQRQADRLRAAGWSEARANLAMDLVDALDTGQATTGSVRRARAALAWDLLLGARWTAVDRRLVGEAIAQADAALPRPAGPAQEEPPTLEWPVSPVIVTSPFGVRKDPLGSGEERHLGIDRAAAQGQWVSAAAAGLVVYVGRRGGYGLHVELRHADGYLTRYAHLSEIDVAAGEEVQAGALLGRAGRTGRATGPHLHFEVWRDGLPVDPAGELAPPMVRLSRRARPKGWVSRGPR